MKTLTIKYKPKPPEKERRERIQGTKWNDPRSPRRPKEPRKMVNHKGNIKFPHPLHIHAIKSATKESENIFLLRNLL
jgi:hypothetical protein